MESRYLFSDSAYMFAIEDFYNYAFNDRFFSLKRSSVTKRRIRSYSTYLKYDAHWSEILSINSHRPTCTLNHSTCCQISGGDASPRYPFDPPQKSETVQTLSDTNVQRCEGPITTLQACLEVYMYNGLNDVVDIMAKEITEGHRYSERCIQNRRE